MNKNSQEAFFKACAEIRRARQEREEATAEGESIALQRAKRIRECASKDNYEPFETIFTRARQLIEELDTHAELDRLNLDLSAKSLGGMDKAIEYNAKYYAHISQLKREILFFFSHRYGYDLEAMEYIYDTQTEE
ncbi:hypothetical protein [Campylobacter sp. RM9328]|uniref:hypothetical protein n=1 Tax=Campylobacter sp. RM9328 TaxID=1705720 RepID=UPI001475BBAA|nr:hypothetical protein [Campylobacter sp. RM9328]